MAEGKHEVRYLGVDLAWRDNTADYPANETGLAVSDGQGVVMDAGWARGVRESLGWAIMRPTGKMR